MWVDQRFAAESPTTLYVTGEPADKPYNNGKVRWLRPHEVADADASQIALTRGGADAGDVIQGELGDCYLLGAMSSVVARDLLNPLIKPGVDPDECIRNGFITFVLYKFGEWVEVSVDTLLPCNEESKPIFAHGKDPNELWVALLEKAYAKLHGSYEALDGGSVTAALVDLTGGVGESIDMTDEDTVYEIADGSFWKRLKRYNQKMPSKGGGGKAVVDDGLGGTYLLGAALSQSSVADQGGTEAMQVTDLGILVNHAYSLVDVQEFLSDNNQQVRLVQLRNPWGMKEWEGPWSDGAPEWETTAGRGAKEKLHVEFKNDGTFWMEWGDFQQHFNRIYVCRIFDEIDAAKLGGRRPAPGQWCRYEVEGEWNERTAGGCFNFPEWRKNPQFEFRIGDQCHAVFLLMQPDPRTLPRPAAQAHILDGSAGPKLGGDDGGPKYDKKIGMYVMRGDPKGDFRRKVLYDSEEIQGDEVSDSTPFMAYREVTCNTFDEEDDQPLQQDEPYVLVPSTFNPNLFSRFRIIVLTSQPLDQPPRLLDPLHQLQISGSWTELNAGGCRNYYTWRRNEQYHLQLGRAARVSVVLMRHNPDVNSSDVALHSKKKVAKTPSKKKKAKDASNFLIGFVVARAGKHTERKMLKLDPADEVDKTQFAPTFEVAAEFMSEGAGSYVIVPTTYEPAKLGDFELVVFTDDERASMVRIEPSTWHLQHLSGEWAGRGAGGCRNYASWVHNPLYQLRASRQATCELFLRQASREDEAALDGAPASYPGLGFYITVDDGSLSLDDVRCESGFRQSIESSSSFDLAADTSYLLIPMTYKKGVEMPFDIEVYCDQPSLRLEQLPRTVADSRRAEMVEHEAARTIVRWFVVCRIWKLLRQRDRERARHYIVTFFRKPVRDNDEGYLDINLALNALESAYIQLTGKSDSKGKFFPQMRDRLRQRGHKIADYDVLL